jgi:hypothetical protein
MASTVSDSPQAAPMVSMAVLAPVARWSDWISTPAGEVMVGFVLMFVGAGFYLWKIPKGDDMIVAGFTLIGRAMVGQAIK